jgi:hypothetical protein
MVDYKEAKKSYAATYKNLRIIIIDVVSIKNPTNLWL